MKNKGRKIATIAMAAAMTGQAAMPVLAIEKTNTNQNTEVKANQSPTVDFRIMATTDLHANIMDHDYYTDTPNQNLGISKIATLIKDAKAEIDKNGNGNDKIDNALLVDNGDTIQGNPLATVYAMNSETKTKPGEKYPAYEALDILEYDAGTLGNHEFNYGLDFLKQITDKSVMKTDIINANVLNTDGTNAFNPYKVVTEEVVDSNGNKQTIKVGITGFVPPQILNWDKQNLEGKVKVEDIKTAADKVTKTLKEKEGVDIVVALAHSGTGDDDKHVENSENAAYQLTKVDGIDVVVAGHSHSTAIAQKNGVQLVQPSNWGKELGVVDLKLTQKDGKWGVVDEESSVERRNVDGKVYGTAKDPIRVGKAAVNDTRITESASLKAAHEATVKYVNSGVGKTTKDLNSFFSLVADNASVELVANSQKSYVEKIMKQGQTELQPYKDLEVLSAAAPFKAGGREFNDPTNFVDIKAGDLKIKDLSNLYIYDNTLTVVKLNGEQIKEWLEMCAGMFNTIDPNSKTEQELFNHNYRSYNFDSIEGLTYEIDVTKPAKYDKDGKTVNANTSRITNLKFKGKDLDPKQEFLVATNNYRGSGTFPGVRDGQRVYESAYENRETIVDYIKEQGAITPSVDNNWKIKSVDSDAKVVFTSHENGKNYLSENQAIDADRADVDGMSKYSYDLNYISSSIPEQKLTGTTRYETATKISQSAFDKAENVVIVNSSAITDGLCATPFAKLKNAPILLTGSKTLDAKTKAEISRLGAKNVYIVGGTNAVDESVVKELKSMNVNVERIAGNDRYQTSLQIAKKLGDVSEVAVVSGQKGLADAVSVAPVAGSKNMAILLSSANNGVKQYEQFIKDEKVNKAYVIGGKSSVSEETAKELPNATRLGGANRNETNAMIIDEFYKGEELNNVYVAKDGMKNESELIDALAVGAVAAKENAPVVIGSKNVDKKQEEVLSAKKTKMLTKVGGNGNEGIFNKLKNVLKK
ncbi:bifunctional 2',3'-cyclic-nucleotide 2'-phosphodiesterase/3'-nucleotidase [Romboutsia lituseburensis]|uniref:2',3'-cyclic-nucleotide 2'-phosphodiesterase / 3'-nucleotidase n=2 Tax=Romboutsia lituseburensis TaxID=1537 RepID=A0A1G9MK95_9FIRM|nr:bifunctional 2',3'-cyclic-nucleotide 2'-phosphodiesterase/3'-nucleotidase [Romboutsia lituseburensis]SDL74327.1 2',3'-cyclic-nucleotide 2'-phosphodiesterase / 3'-nucleotidase [Romboutsia lituseburensis DSM 797]